jgi:hypothetical protein
MIPFSTSKLLSLRLSVLLLLLNLSTALAGTSCTQGKFGQKFIKASEAQIAVDVWMNTVGCRAGQGGNLITVGHAGGIVKVTNGITVVLGIGRDEDIQVSCDNLSASWQSIISTCGSAFGGIVDNGIWEVRIMTPSPPLQPQRRLASSVPEITAAAILPKSTDGQAAHLLDKRATTSTTTVVLPGGVTATFLIAEPTQGPTGVYEGNPNNVENALVDIHLDLLELTGFGQEMGVFARADIADNHNPGSVEMDLNFNVQVGPQFAEGTIIEINTIATNLYRQNRFNGFTFSVFGPAGQSFGGGAVNVFNHPVDRFGFLFGFPSWGPFGHLGNM